MIQRIQSVYLVMATVSSGVMIFLLNLWYNRITDIKAYDLLFQNDISLTLVPVLFVLSAFVSFVTIFKFKNRKLQMKLGRLTILINLILLGLFVYLLQTLSGEASVSEKDIGMFLPLLTILLVLLANRAIKKDEDLVKSVDRLR